MDPNMTTNLLDRYLQAVGDHLPAATRDDVLSELRANLQAQIDDRAEELDRPLTEPKVAAILKDHGRPLIVAARYSPQQYLIGPAIFPYYLMTLRKIAPFAVVILFLANCSNLILARTGPELIAGILRALGQLIPDIFMLVMWITIAFAIAEYVYASNHAKPLGLSWDPTRLPALKPQVKGRSHVTRIADLVFHCLWIAYVLEIPSHPFLILGPSIQWLRVYSLAFASSWHTYYVLLLVLLGVQLVAKLIATNPTLDPWRSPLDLVVKLFGVGAAGFLVNMKIYLVATGPSVNLAKLAAVNHAMNIAFEIVLVLCLVQLLIEAWKLISPSFRSRSLVF
jgi:hypothetical protein